MNRQIMNGMTIMLLTLLILGLTVGAASAEPINNVTNITTADGSYKAGDVINITLTFNESVNVTGVPSIMLNVDPTRYANYTSGANGTTLLFTYTVQAGDTAANLEAFNLSALVLNGGAIINETDLTL